MSDDIRRDYERLAGESLPAPSNDSGRGFGSLRTTFILLTILAMLIGLQQVVSRGLIGVQPGQIVICQSTTGDITPIREPGFHWCFGEATAFFEQRAVEGIFPYRFKDGIPGGLKVSLIYSIPAEGEYAYDPAVVIFTKYGTQEVFEKRGIRPELMEAVQEAFGNISSQTLLAAPEKVAPLVHESIRLYLRGGLMEQDIYIEVLQLNMKGRATVPLYRGGPRPDKWLRPRLRMPHAPEIPIQYEDRKYSI